MYPCHKQLPQNLYLAEQVRQLDQRAVEVCKITGYELMQRAGNAAFECIRTNWPDITSLVVYCGPGNNGGDGFVIARLAQEAGFTIRVLCVVEQDKLSGDAKLAADDLVKSDVVIESCDQTVDETDCLLVDAIFGTGLNRPATPEIAELINRINVSPAPVLAVDIPSGIHADTGEMLGVSVRAQATITFIALKQGLFTSAAPEYCGEIFFTDLAVTAATYKGIEPSARLLNQLQLNDYFPQKRKADSHKGNFGHVLVIGGDSGYAGAPRMAGEAAARTGAGLVSIATRQQNIAAFLAGCPELMVHDVSNGEDLSTLIEKATVIAIGPGLGQSRWAQSLLATVLESDKPLIVDADALNILAAEPCQNSNWILTPHPGEAARLMNTTTREIQADRFNAIRELQTRYGGVIVLKGSGSLVIDQSGQISVIKAGNPGMATGGMGDVLTGILAGLVAQGLTIDQAACMGSLLHARAGDLAAEAGQRGLLAMDLMPWIRHLMNFG